MGLNKVASPSDPYRGARVPLRRRATESIVWSSRESQASGAPSVKVGHVKGLKEEISGEESLGWSSESTSSTTGDSIAGERRFRTRRSSSGSEDNDLCVIDLLNEHTGSGMYVQNKNSSDDFVNCSVTLQRDDTLLISPYHKRFDETHSYKVDLDLVLEAFSEDKSIFVLLRDGTKINFVVKNEDPMPAKRWAALIGLSARRASLGNKLWKDFDTGGMHQVVQSLCNMDLRSGFLACSRMQNNSLLLHRVCADSHEITEGCMVDEWLTIQEQALIYLLEYFPAGAKAKNEEGNLPLHLLLKTCTKTHDANEMVRELLRAHPDAISEKDASGNCALHISAAKLCFRNVHTLLEWDSPTKRINTFLGEPNLVSAVNNNDETILHILLRACVQDSEISLREVRDICAFALHHESKPFLGCDQDGFNVFHYACDLCDPLLLLRLFDSATLSQHGLEYLLRQKNKHGITPLEIVRNRACSSETRNTKLCARMLDSF